MYRRLFFTTLGLLAVFGLIISGYLSSVMIPNPSSGVQQIPSPVIMPDQPPVAAQPQSAAILPNSPPTKLSYAPVLKQIKPAVVDISTLQAVQQPMPHTANDPSALFQFFFSGRSPQGFSRSTGSGVIVDPKGVIVTCLHVIKDAQKIVVRLHDNRTFEGEIMAQDPQNDLAVLRLKSFPHNETLPFVPLETTEAEDGDVVLAIGNPFNVGNTVSAGIISATGRNIDGHILIQTDTPMNPGNSGGPLINTLGNLVGISNKILSRTGTNAGIGFAIPVGLVHFVLNNMQPGGTVLHPWSGIHAQALTPELAATLGLATPQGVLVTAFHPLSPALAAGLKQGDVITAVNGRMVSNPSDLVFRLQSIALNQDITLTIQRDKMPGQIQFRLIEPPAVPVPDQRRAPPGTYLENIEVANISPAMVVKYQIPQPVPDKGVVIVDPGQNLLSLQFGLRKGDIIEAINGQPIDSVETLFQEIAGMEQKGTITIRRGSSRNTIQFHRN
jgi:serine protease Do